VRTADNLVTFMCQLSGDSGSTSHLESIHAFTQIALSVRTLSNSLFCVENVTFVDVTCSTLNLYRRSADCFI